MNRWLIGLVVLGGCVSAKPGADTVVFTSDRTMVAGCHFVEQATFTAIGSETFASAISEDAINKLRNRAVEVRATHSITAGPTGMSPGVMGITGDLYKCGAAAPG